jgi:hypothetical protein
MIRDVKAIRLTRLSLNLIEHNSRMQTILTPQVWVVGDETAHGPQMVDHE